MIDAARATPSVVARRTRFVMVIGIRRTEVADMPVNLKSSEINPFREVYTRRTLAGQPLMRSRSHGFATVDGALRVICQEARQPIDSTVPNPKDRKLSGLVYR